MILFFISFCVLKQNITRGHFTIRIFRFLPISTLVPCDIRLSFQKRSVITLQLCAVILFGNVRKPLHHRSSQNDFSIVRCLSVAVLYWHVSWSSSKVFNNSPLPYFELFLVCLTMFWYFSVSYICSFASFFTLDGSFSVVFFCCWKKVCQPNFLLTKSALECWYETCQEHHQSVTAKAWCQLRKQLLEPHKNCCQLWPLFPPLFCIELTSACAPISSSSWREVFFSFYRIMFCCWWMNDEERVFSSGWFSELLREEVDESFPRCLENEVNTKFGVCSRPGKVSRVWYFPAAWAISWSFRNFWHNTNIYRTEQWDCT